jgi:hypothetical protein
MQVNQLEVRYANMAMEQPTDHYCSWDLCLNAWNYVGMYFDQRTDTTIALILPN